MQFAREFFAELHQNFQQAAESGRVVTADQSLIIECFAIAAYNIYIPSMICP